MIKKRYIILLLTLIHVCVGMTAQDLNFNEEIRRRIESGGKKPDATHTDTARVEQDSLLIPADSLLLPETQITSDTVVPADSIFAPPLSMSEEALYWSRHAQYEEFGPDVTYRDTIIVNPLFLPVLFKEENIMPREEISLYRPDFQTRINEPAPLYQPVSLFENQQLKMAIEDIASCYIQRNHPNVFRYIAQQLPSEKTRIIQKKEEIKLPVEKKEVDPVGYAPPTKFIPDRRYWTSSFESALQFSQNYVSPNWHKGGTSNLNVFTKNLAQYNYAKGKVQVKNLMEINVSFYNAPKDSLREYKLGDDLFRFYSNIGYRAFSKWFYTFDAEFKTQMFANYKENTVQKQAALLSPYTVVLGLGMKYDLVKKYARKDRSLTISLNIAPFSYKYMYSIDEEIDLGRHGFQKEEGTDVYKHQLSQLGSNLRYDMVVKPNRNVTWKSRFEYFTSYDRMVGEFENSLDLAISRYFSTKIYVLFRYDDSVTKVLDHDSFLQTNEILSFGFSYKW